MILGNISQFSDFSFLDEKIKACLAYITEHDLKALAPGRYELDGNRMYMNLEEFKTLPAKNRSYEAHQKYLDIFYIVDGMELVDVNFLDQMTQEDYNSECDRATLTGESACSAILKTGDFLICYPQDAHRPATAVGEPQIIKKAVFKVLI